MFDFWERIAEEPLLIGSEVKRRNLLIDVGILTWLLMNEIVGEVAVDIEIYENGNISAESDLLPVNRVCLFLMSWVRSTCHSILHCVALMVLDKFSIMISFHFAHI